MSPSLLLLLLLASSLCPVSSGRSTMRRLVSFHHPDLHHVAALLLSNDSSTLYVGAQDFVFSLDVSAGDSITLKGKEEWRPTERQVRECSQKAKNATVTHTHSDAWSCGPHCHVSHVKVDCPNLVGVLLQINATHLYACGSHAYSPEEVYIDMDSFSRSPGASGKLRCPFNPFERSTAIAVGGELFTATTADFRGQNPHVARFFTEGGRTDVSLEASSSLLDEPTFISSTLDAAERKLYFFFSEVGKEYTFEEKIRIPRVARVCKDDVGGQRTLQRKWTSFAKSSLLCPSQKGLFSQLQDVFILQPAAGADAGNTLFYSVFTSEWSAAVCVFSLQKLRTVFSSYRTLDKKTSRWTQLAGHPNLGQCGLDAASDSVLEVVKRSYLTSGAIRPEGGAPVLMSTEQYRRVVAMTTQGVSGREYRVLFLLTESGLLHKVVLFQDGAHVVEEIRVFTGPQLFYNLLLSGSKDVVYVGTSDGVTAVPVVDCSVHTSCLQCVLTRDPQCGWSRGRRECSVLDSSEDIVQVLEDGSVEEACRDQTGPVTEVRVHLKDPVTLPCQKPRLAAVTWTHSRFSVLPETLYVQSAGDLRFFASPKTMGLYHCHAQVHGSRLLVSSYNVLQVAPPRSHSPPLNDNGGEEAVDLSWVTSLPLSTDSPVKQQGALCEQGGSQTSLVVVSLLLVVCVCLLMAAVLYTWCRRSQRLEWSKGQQDSPAEVMVD
ncbi:semaphorin-4A-like isoform X1 [Synchiropus splendidus]|uniref:semaphorin-4A-like isoform X1 n=1 Tax=Synchiropus splendidus TaxID=270530 RepID=UPI00237DB529|nr:semaphorin-4A-like isoform X1 [Synchiropus splendidus]